jgi:hypothetical protein
MTRARRYVRIVSCIRPSDLDDDRLSHGARALADLFADIEARRTAVELPDDSEPMLIDLARRLEARGMTVALGHRGKLPLVASRGGYCVAVETDAALSHLSLRESLRLRPDLLRRLGWHYARVHVFELFSDPEAVADRLFALAGGAPVAGSTAAGAPAATSAASRPAGVVGTHTEELQIQR